MKYLRIWVAAAAFFIAGSASAQQAGTVTSHAFAVGKGAGKSSFTSILCASAQVAVGQSAADPICQTLTGDVTVNASGVTAIGASKVTNSQTATMLANTTKCNATAGTTNPTDCSASTMKTNLGLVIGTNVEAWDTDLDCLAALSTTGVVHRTGSGTCSAGSVALTDLVTGTQDTVIGYFGATTGAAASLPNCSNSLTYSTSTHTFGCNTSAGTGTVTSVATAGLASGGPITSTGTVTVTAAVKSDQTTATSNTVAVTPAVQQFHGSAAKATCFFNGTLTGSNACTGASFNVTGIARNSTGNYTAVFPTAFASSTSYGCIAFLGSSSVNGAFQGLNTQTTTNYNFIFETFSNVATDATTGMLVCYGTE